MPTYYTDSQGQSRFFRLNVFAVSRIEAATGIDLYQIEKQSEWTSDPAKVAHVLYAAQGGSETPDAWADAHIGDAFERAFDAFAQALIDFFPSRLATPLRQMLQAQQTLNEISGELLASSELTPEA